MIKKRILITGSNGLLGQKLTQFYLQREGIELLPASIEPESISAHPNYVQLDIADKTSVKKCVRNFYPDIIINAAAFTNVDACESRKEEAWNINVIGVENLCRSALTSDATLIHVSTDYIFDGEDGPYNENAKPNPINYYGRTKLAAENIIRSAESKHVIARTNILYGSDLSGKSNFVGWVIASLEAGKEIRIVTDQVGNPTLVDDLVLGINGLIEFKKSGIYNIAGPIQLSRYDFTLKIADYFGLNKNLIKKIVTADLKQPALRPLKAGLINLKAETEIGYKPRSISDSMELIKKELFS